jgi:UDP-N-acetylglucosamine diphosphorylase / glucose-1-phosphate thymidylyltransferase / UDP-N-acetylgalactosamine diphosphorylase / glucosamine-1-phosphate N-acetyltransferase / galactosamine-1-phosphate N-acetyltransferase
MKKVSAVVMAAGKGTRFLPLTSSLPKPLIKIVGSTPLDYNLDNLHTFVDEIVIVVGHLKQEIVNHIGSNFKGVPIKYVNQSVPLGTAHALYCAKSKVKNSQIIVINGDDIYSKNLIGKTLQSGNVIVGKKEMYWKSFGVLKAGQNKFLDHIVEKPDRFVGDLINIGLYKFGSNIFDYYRKIVKSPRGEYEITDLISEFAKDNPIEIVSCKTGWNALSFPWSLLDFVENKLSDLKTDVRGAMEKGVVIKGNIYLGKNSKIKSGSYLEGNFFIGDNCEIGPNCFLKGFGSFDNRVSVGNAVEITRSLIGNKTKIKHLSYIGDSIIGNRVNIGAGTKVANMRHDGNNVLVKVNDKLVDTERRKFGVIIGDGVKTGINTLLYPGSKLETDSFTYPGEVIRYEVSRI